MGNMTCFCTEVQYDQQQRRGTAVQLVNLAQIELAGDTVSVKHLLCAAKGKITVPPWRFTSPNRFKHNQSLLYRKPMTSW